MNACDIGNEAREAWLRASKLEERTRENFQRFYRRTLHNFGARGIVKAIYDEAGNCTTCGEAGRCAGYHYSGEGKTK